MFDIWRSANRYQQLVERLIVALPMRVNRESNAALVFDRQVLPATEERDAVSCDRPLHDLRCVTVFARQDAVFRLDQKHFRPQLRERLRHLATDRPGANDAESSGKLGQREYCFVGQIVH